MIWIGDLGRVFEWVLLNDVEVFTAGRALVDEKFVSEFFNTKLPPATKQDTRMAVFITEWFSDCYHGLNAPDFTFILAVNIFNVSL